MLPRFLLLTFYYKLAQSSVITHLILNDNDFFTHHMTLILNVNSCTCMFIYPQPNYRLLSEKNACYVAANASSSLRVHI